MRPSSVSGTALLLNLLLLSGVLLTGCSHRSSRRPALPPPPVHDVSVLIDTEAGTNVTLTAFVMAAALEAPNGTLSSNLLPAPRELVMTDPLGRASLLKLEDVPSGKYVAVHLLVPTGGLYARMEDGRKVVVDTASQDIVIRFADGVGLKGLGHEIWQGMHTARLLLLLGDQGVPNWSPGLALHTDPSSRDFTSAAATAGSSPARHRNCCSKEHYGTRSR